MKNENKYEDFKAPFRAGSTVTIVGVGLISGSFALGLKDKKIANHIIVFDINKKNEKKALQLGIIDESLPLKEAVTKS